MLCSPVAPRPLCALLQHAVCDAPFTDRLALSSSVRSNHCTDAVCRGSMTRAWGGGWEWGWHGPHLLNTNTAMNYLKSSP